MYERKTKGEYVRIGKLGAKLRWENEPPYEERFWKRVTIGAAADCWTWNGKPNKKSGYGNIKYYGKWTSAHRIAYLLSNGPIPNGLCVLHTCDNRICVNPKHLWVGTKGDNNRDRHQKGRDNPPRGERQTRRKLDESDVLEIRNWLQRGQTQMSIAAAFGVDQSTVSDIKRRERWKHI